MNAEQTIHELLDPQTGLHCLPAFWKASCRDEALARSPADQARYVDENLMVLVRYVEPFARERTPSGEPTPFAALCDSLAAACSFEDVGDRLGFSAPDTTDPFIWLDIAIEYQLTIPICLYAAGAQLVSPVLDSEYPDNLRGVPRILLAKALNDVGKSSLAVKVLESYLGFDEIDYRDGATMCCTLARSAKLLELTANNRALFLSLLADSLHGVSGQGSVQAAMLLESHVGLDQDDYRDGAAMRSALARSENLAGLEANNRAILLMTLAKFLCLIGSRGLVQASRVLESYLGFDERDYRDDTTMCCALAQSAKLLELTANNRMSLLSLLAESLRGVSGRGSVKAAMLLESHLGLYQDDYRDGAAMRSALDCSTKLAELEANNRANLLRILAEALSFVSGRGNPQAALLLETYVGLNEEDYGDGMTMRSALARSATLAGLDANHRVDLLSVLAHTFELIDGRGHAQAARLLESHAGLDEDDYRDEVAMRSAISCSTELVELEPNRRAVFLFGLATALRSVSGRGSEQSLRLLESYLKLDERNYRDRTTMCAALAHSTTLAELEANNQANLLRTVAEILGFADDRDSEQAVWLLESYLNLDERDYQDGTEMRSALDCSTKLTELADDNRATCLRVLADALRFVPGRGSVHATRLLEAYLQLDQGDYGDHSAMRSALARSANLAELTATSRVTLVSSLADALWSVNDRGGMQAAVLLESYLTKPIQEFATAPELHNVAALDSLDYVNTWLCAVDGSHECAFATCRALVAFVYDLREDVLSSYEQRVAFLSQARKTWHTLQRVALERIEYERGLGTVGVQRAELMLLELHYWAEQFHNRLLVERLFVEPPSGGGEGAAALGDWEPWRCALLRAEDESDGMTARQDSRGTPADASLALASCLSDRSGTAVVSSPRVTSAPLEVSRELRRQLLAPAGQEPELHDLVPPGVVWVRALLDEEGRLRWWAWQREGDDLRLLDEGASKPGAVNELAEANLRFDLEVERTWGAYEGRTFDGLQDEDHLRHLLQLVIDEGIRKQLLADRDKTLATREVIGEALVRLDQVAPSLAWLCGNFLDLELDEGFRNLVLGEYPNAVPATWMTEDFAAGLDMLANPWDEIPADRERKRREVLDAASHRHLAVFQQHFDLRSLWPKLPLDRWAETDILFQVPGPVLAGPLAWLPFGPDGAKLLDTVASTGSIISLTLRQQAEREAQTPLRRILSVHWEEPKQRRHGEQGIYQLEHGVVKAGRDRDWEVWCLGDQPEATAANLQAAINNAHRRFGVLVVNGHGIRETYGVKLAQDTQWQGTGADLRDTDLILLAACSLGRLLDNGVRDVEGLYAELAAHHGRTVIAARWPIADMETATFTSEVVREYLAVADAAVDAGRALPPFSRARALNRARRRLLASHDITFHLAAAFEIYGLG